MGGGGIAFHFSVTFVMVKIIRFIQCYYTETRPYEHEEHLHTNAPHVSANPGQIELPNERTNERIRLGATSGERYCCFY